MRFAEFFPGIADRRLTCTHLRDQLVEVRLVGRGSEEILGDFDTSGSRVRVGSRVVEALGEELQAAGRYCLCRTRLYQSQCDQPAFVAGRGGDVVLEGCVAATACTVKNTLFAFDLQLLGRGAGLGVARGAGKPQQVVDRIAHRGWWQLLERELRIVEQRQVGVQVVTDSVEYGLRGLLVLRREVRDLCADGFQEGLHPRFDVLPRAFEIGPPVRLQGCKVRRRRLGARLRFLRGRRGHHQQQADAAKKRAFLQ